MGRVLRLRWLFGIPKVLVIVQDLTDGAPMALLKELRVGAATLRLLSRRNELGYDDI